MRACPARRPRDPTQMTITSAASLPKHSARVPIASLVIIVVAMSGALPASAGEPSGLSTVAAATPAHAAVATVLPAATLTTVVIEGSSIYQPPQLFASYGNALGHP